MVFYKEDIEEFLDCSGFATLLVVKSNKIAGIFDHQYVEYADISGNHPAFLCASEAASSIELGGDIIIDERSYTIAAIQPDGTGLTLLVLHEA